MKVLKLKLNNYRNYSSIEVSFSPGTNIILGKNAQGKTNLLEAIFTCAIGKSMRAVRDNEVIKWGEENAKIELEVEKRFGKSKIEIYFFKAGKKQLKSIQCQLNELANCLANFDVFSSRQTNLNLLKKVQKIAEDLWTYLFRKFQKHTLTYLINMKKLFHQETNF